MKTRPLRWWTYLIFFTNMYSGREAHTEQLDHFSHVLIGGDQLTAARVRGADRVMGNSNNGQERLEGLVPVVEDWHAKVCFLQVRSCHCTYCVSTRTMEGGTLYQIQNLINRRNVAIERCKCM